MTTLLRACVVHCFHRPAATLALATLVLLASLLLASKRLDLRMEWTYLFEKDDPVVVQFQEAQKLFPYPGDLVVLVDGGTAGQRERYMQVLAERLAARPAEFFHTIYSWDFGELADKALYFAEVDQLRALADLLEPPTSGARDISREIQGRVLSELSATLKSRGQHRPSLRSLLGSDGHEPEKLELALGLIRGQTHRFLTLADGRIHVLATKGGTARSPVASTLRAVTSLRSILAELRPVAGPLRVRLTGLPVLLHDERATCSRDSLRTGLLSLGMVALILLLGFGQAIRPCLAVAALLYGMGWTIGFTTLAVGHLNFITVTMTTMLAGLGIDFGIHLLLRYQEEQDKGLSPLEAIEGTVAETGLDNLVGAMATSLAFATLTLVGFQGIADLGVIAAGGVLLCYLATVTVLPALLALSPVSARPLGEPWKTLAAWELQLLRRPGLTVAVGTVLLGLALFSSRWVRCDYNMLEVQAPELESVCIEKEMIREHGRSALGASVVVADQDEARRLAQRLERLPSVESAVSLAQLIPTDIAQKRPYVQRIVTAASHLRLPAPIPLESARDLRALRERVAGLGDRRAQPPIHEVDRQLEQVKSVIRSMGPGVIQDGLEAFQTGLRQEAERVLVFLRKQRTEPPTMADFPAALKVRFLSQDGHYLVNVQPAGNVWQPEVLTDFLAQVRGVTPGLVGHPVVSSHIISSFRMAQRKAPWLALAGVYLVMGLYLRNWRNLLLALLPTSMGVIGVLGAMGASGVSFNVVNFVALPICVGIGAVYGVHAVHRIREQDDCRLMSNSTGASLVLSGATTLAGFGCLVLARHNGMASLGWVISVGVAINLFASLVLLPALVSVTGRHRSAVSRESRPRRSGRPD